MKFDIVDLKGKVVDSIEVESTKAPSSHELYLVDKYIKAANFESTASTKTRGRVRGGGKKPFRQKGTGRARQGTSRSPLKVGGGIVFGPSPRSMAIQLNKKQIRSVIKQSLLTLNDKVKVIKFDDSSFSGTKAYEQFVGSDSEKPVKIQFVLNLDEADVWKSIRNHSNTKVSTVTSVDLFNIHLADRVYMSLAAFNELVEGAE